MCRGCSAVSSKLPDGVEAYGPWVLPVCDVPPKGTDAMSDGTNITTITLEKGYYCDSPTSTHIRKCYRPEAYLGGDTYYSCAIGYEGACEAMMCA